MATHTDLELAGRRGRIHLHRWDSDADPRVVVLLAHGYGEHAERYAHVADALVGAGAAVYAPDHRGHGRSEGERALVDDAEELVEDLDAVADVAASEQPGLPIVLIGHSMGGLVATRYAQQHQETLRGLVLSGPVIGGNPDIEALMQMDPIPDVPIDPDVLSRDPAVGRAYAEDPLVYHGPFRRETLESLFAAVASVATGPRLDLPTLWIHGEDDQLAPLEHTRAAIADLHGEDFEEHIYPEARHEIFNEINRDEVIATVIAFIDRVLRAG